MIPVSFDYLTPTTLGEAVEALVSHGEDARVIAGGHSLLPMMKLRLTRPGVLVDLSKIPELSGIQQENGQITIGALTTHYEIESSDLLMNKCPLLPRTARVIGDAQVRNRGTIGGSLAHADPAADIPASILALGGELRARGPDSDRWIQAKDFFLGLMTTALKPGEILTEIRVPVLSERVGTSYQKAAQKASGFAIVGVAVHLGMAGELCAEIGVGVTGLGSKPYRARGVEEGLRGRKLEPSVIETVSSQVAQDVDPLDDLHSSAEFRAHLARLCTARAIEEAVQRAGGKET